MLTSSIFCWPHFSFSLFYQYHSLYCCQQMPWHCDVCVCFGFSLSILWMNQEWCACMHVSTMQFFFSLFICEDTSEGTCFVCNPNINNYSWFEVVNNLSCDHHYNLSKFQAIHEYSTMWRNYKCFPKMGLLNLIKCYHCHFIQATWSSTIKEIEGTLVVELKP